MAVRGTELRLAIIVSNQASFALSRIGGDLRRLQSQTTAFDRNQIRTLGQLAQQREKVARLGSKAAQAELSTSAQIGRNLAAQARIGEKLYNMGVRGAALQSMLNAQYKTANLTESQRLAVQLQALKLDAKRLVEIEAQNAALQVQIGEEEALARRIASVGMAEAARLDAMERRMGQLQRQQIVGRSISHVGRAATFGGLISATALTATAGAYAQFNTQSTLAATQTRDAGESFLQTAKNATILEEAILDLTRTFPASASEMSDAAYQIYSSTQASFGGGLKLLQMFNKAAVAGGVDLQTATAIGIRILNDFDEQFRKTGKVTDETAYIMNRAFAIVRYGAINFQEFGQIMEQVAPAAFSTGQSIDDVAGAIGILTRVLGPAKTGAGLARLLEVFTREEFQIGMEKMNARITDMKGNLLPLPQIIAKIAAVSRGLPESVNLIQKITQIGAPDTKGLQGTIQARRALNALIEDTQAYSTLQVETTRNQDEFNQAFEAMRRTPGVRWAVMINQLKALVLIIGESAIPVIADIIDKVTVWVHKWEDLDQKTRDTIVKWGVIISVGSLLGGLILSLVGSIISLSAELVGLGESLGGPRGVATEVTKLATSLRLLAGIGTIAIGIELIKKGGGWRTLGFALAAAGLVGSFRGAKAGGLAGVIVLGIQLQAQGGGTLDWKSRVGALLTGAASGAMIGGAPGAVIGAAVSLSINESRLADQQGEIFKNFVAMREKADEFSKAANISSKVTYANLLQEMQRVTAGGGSMAEAIAAANALLDKMINKRITPIWAESVTRVEEIRSGLSGVNEEHEKTVSQMIKELGASTTIEEIMKRIASETGDAADEADRLALNLIKAAKAGNLKELQKWLDKFVDMQDRSPAEILAAIKKAAEAGNLDEVKSLMTEYAQAVKSAETDAAKAAEDAADRIQAKHKAIEKAVEDTKDTIKSTVQELIDTYKQLNDSAFGTLGAGPILSGEFGQIFTDLFNDLKNFGTPLKSNVAIPMKMITDDLERQTQNFQRVRENIELLRKRGAPPELIKQIMEMGEGGEQFLESLRRASPGAFKAYVKQFNAAQAEIDKATKIDVSNKLSQWEKQGSAMMKALITGVKRESDKLDEFFINYINQKFPNILKQAAKEAGVKYEKDNPPKKRAHGGSVIPGQVYRVGEFGPETLTFDRPGTISPSTRSTPSGTVQHTEYHDHTVIHADGATTEAVMRALNKQKFRMRTTYRYGK